MKVKNLNIEGVGGVLDEIWVILSSLLLFAIPFLDLSQSGSEFFPLLLQKLICTARFFFPTKSLYSYKAGFFCASHLLDDLSHSNKPHNRVKVFLKLYLELHVIPILKLNFKNFTLKLNQFSFLKANKGVICFFEVSA